MSAISTWSTTAASNNAAAPNGWPEGQAPSSLNNCGRELMAALRTQHEQACWIDYGHTPTRTADLQFTVTGDQTATYTVGRRVRFTDTTSKYGYITVSAYTTLTTVTIVMDSGVLVSPTAVAVGILDSNCKITTEQVLAGEGILNSEAFSAGMIMLWSGAISAIPSGWLLCDGTNSTPDLRKMMVVGAVADAGGLGFDVGDTGGTKDWKDGVDTVSAHTHGTDDPGTHTHPLTSNAAVGSGGIVNSTGGGAGLSMTSDGGGAHTHTTNSQSPAAADWTGKYYTLAYIMKS